MNVAAAKIHNCTTQFQFNFITILHNSEVGNIKLMGLFTSVHSSWFTENSATKTSRVFPFVSRWHTQLNIARSAIKSPVYIKFRLKNASPVSSALCNRWHIYWTTITVSGFGGLVLSMLASGTQDRGFKPGRSLRIFRATKILNMLS
jgi:hypothetical protein